MYNESQKLRFFNSEGAPKGSIISYEAIFSQSEATEIKHGRDICEFSESEATELLSSTFGVKYNSKAVSFRRINVYVDWCVKNGLCRANNFRRIDVKHIYNKTMLDCMVKDDIHLQEELDRMLRPEELETTDEQFRALFWLAFIGVPCWELAVRLVCDDVDFENDEVRFGPFTFSIGHRQAKLAIKKMVKLEYLNQERPEWSGKFAYKKRWPGDQLLRGIRGPFVEVGGRTRLNRLFQRNEKNPERPKFRRLDFDDVYESGIFYRAYLEERKNKNYKPPFELFVKRELDIEEYLKGKGKKNVSDVIIQKKARAYDIEYAMWKRVFGYQEELDKLHGRTTNNK